MYPGSASIWGCSHIYALSKSSQLRLPMDPRSSPPSPRLSSCPVPIRLPPVATALPPPYSATRSRPVGITSLSAFVPRRPAVYRPCPSSASSTPSQRRSKLFRYAQRPQLRRRNFYAAMHRINAVRLHLTKLLNHSRMPDNLGLMTRWRSRPTQPPSPDCHSGAILYNTYDTTPPGYGGYVPAMTRIHEREKWKV